MTALGTPRCRASHSSSWPLSGLSSAWSRRRSPTTRPPGSGTVIVRPPGRESSMDSADPGRSLRLDDVPIAVEPLELQLERRDGHRVGTRVQVGQGLVLRDPGAVQVVRERLLARLVEDVDGDVLAELPEARDGVAGEVVDEVGPVLEGRVVGDACLEGHRLVGRLAW